MKPLYVLVGAFISIVAGALIIHGSANYILAGNWAMAIMLFFTAIGHFAFTEGMAMMIPPEIPFRKPLVIITGILEIVAAICLLINSVRAETSWLLIVLFIVMLPSNIYASINHINYQKANYDGPDTTYLWFRIPLQVFFICWVWYFGT